MMRIYTLALIAVSTTLFLSGCGSAKNEGRVKVYKVTGKITMSGGPVAGANVAFAPRDGQPIAIGRTNDAGEYTLTTYDQNDGAAAGKFAVVVKKLAASSTTAPQSEHGPNYSSSHSAQPKASAKSGSLIPGNYGDSKQTPLTATVEEKDEQVFDFDLK